MLRGKKAELAVPNVREEVEIMDANHREMDKELAYDEYVIDRRALIELIRRVGCNSRLILTGDPCALRQ